MSQPDHQPNDDGVLWAYHLDGKGGGTPVDPANLEAPAEPTGFAWFHIQCDASGTIDWLRRQRFAENLVDAMTTIGTRPRAMPLEDGHFIVLRGVNTNPGADPEDMVSLRIWFTPRIVLTGRRKGRRLLSAQDVRDTVEAGSGPTTPGELVLALVERIADRIGHFVDTIDDELTGFETNLAELQVSTARRELSISRRQAAAIRRYLAPQRDALDALFRMRGILKEDEAYALREQTDRITRYVEDLDLARERAMVLHEELQNRIAEQQNSRMYVLSIVAAIFLPLSFLTGVFGMNVAGLPGTELPAAFDILAVSMGVVGVALLAFMRWRGWL